MCVSVRALVVPVCCERGLYFKNSLQLTYFGAFFQEIQGSRVAVEARVQGPDVSHTVTDPAQSVWCKRVICHLFSMRWPLRRSLMAVHATAADRSTALARGALRWILRASSPDFLNSTNRSRSPRAQPHVNTTLTLPASRPLRYGPVVPY